ncbi:hypothetical protein A6M14_10065 [Acinetobacter sp. Ac_877]|uniref:hypothetical protein n=1 Tax=Acinetobacter portensis TaxID=1839785 RepID=UPI00128C1277|nr:hypothetical protein [Acinetobacter portensis]MPW41814.1 hypothetical protein [Acinetobacter portensis]
MVDLYEYRYTKLGVFGSLPTHKIFLNAKARNTAKFVFSDNTFIYGVVSDWFLKNSDFDTRKSTWTEENKAFLDTEKRLLTAYRALHPLFKTEANTN